ncbi:hypothetical protein DPMN_102050 [Dreissena polymorpha]|uniref:Uncharacterized protein n=1 Tax=Dreissena polymorpha TaxID=45954 RepID=A0A9D4LMD8_DREPO|nr:hypothetical protein DPMN_102050 [Dreissena polymorpha]
MNIAQSPDPSRFANAGRPARTGMMRRNFLTRSHYFTVPPRLKPVNNPAVSRSTADILRFIPVKPRQSHVGATVKAGSVPAEPVYTGAIPASDPGRATATPLLNADRRR